MAFGSYSDIITTSIGELTTTTTSLKVMVGKTSASSVTLATVYVKWKYASDKVQNKTRIYVESLYFTNDFYEAKSAYLDGTFTYVILYIDPETQNTSNSGVGSSYIVGSAASYEIPIDMTIDFDNESDGSNINANIYVVLGFTGALRKESTSSYGSYTYSNASENKTIDLSSYIPALPPVKFLVYTKEETGWSDGRALWVKVDGEWRQVCGLYKKTNTGWQNYGSST